MRKGKLPVTTEEDAGLPVSPLNDPTKSTGSKGLFGRVLGTELKKGKSLKDSKQIAGKTVSKNKKKGLI